MNVASKMERSVYLELPLRYFSVTKCKRKIERETDYGKRGSNRKINEGVRERNGVRQ